MIYYNGLNRLYVPCNCHNKDCFICSSQRYNTIKNQVEYYFGDKNFVKDKFLQNLMDDDRFVPVERILEFPRMVEHKAMHDDVLRVCFALISAFFVPIGLF